MFPSNSPSVIAYLAPLIGFDKNMSCRNERPLCFALFLSAITVLIGINTHCLMIFNLRYSISLHIHEKMFYCNDLDCLNWMNKAYSKINATSENPSPSHSPTNYIIVHRLTLLDSETAFP